MFDTSDKGIAHETLLKMILCGYEKVNTEAKMIS